MFTQWNHKIVLAFLALLISSAAVFAAQQSPDGVWQQVDRAQLPQPGIDSPALPTAYQTFRLNRAALDAILSSAPEEFTSSRAAVLSLPMPDGTFSRFEIEHSLVVERGLLEKYPELGATYRARGLDDPTAYARFDLLPDGFHLMVLSTRGTVLVNPYMQADADNYISFFKHDQPRVGEWRCFVHDTEDDSFNSLLFPKGFDSGAVLLPNGTPPDVTSGTQLRTYRLALAANNEYCTAVGTNTVAGCLAAQVLIMNRVNGVYEKDVAIHMNIVANNNLIVYAGDNLTCPVPGGNQACTSANDPYSNGTNAINENTPNLNTVIGSANYDIGHVFTTGSGGVAQLSVPCGGSKGAGTTGLPNPVGDGFAIDYVAHEMGHQWGGNHTFNSSCGNNRASNAAYEPGSGITIMAYAGVCDGIQELAAHSIDTFHVKSLQEIIAYSQTGQGNNCAVTTASGNIPPTVTGPGNFNIPKQTPFSLTATSSDPNGDTVTYDWEEYDLGTTSTAAPNEDVTAIRPIFRPYLPTASGTRTFPKLNYILSNANVPPTYVGGFMAGELLPAVTRTMTFQVVARDNHAGTGGINTATSVVTVDGNSGPFAVTSPNTGVTISGGSDFAVTWNAAGTTNPPVSAANVKISLSTDGGNTFPTVLAASTANDGTENVAMPSISNSTCRIKIEAVGNIFFDISDANFTLIPLGASPSPSATPSSSPSPTPGCTPSWTAGPNVPAVAIVRSFGVFFPANGRFYNMGGRTADTAGSDTTHPFEYDPVTNTWAIKAATYPDNQVNNMACGLLTVSGTPLIYCVGGSEAAAPVGAPRATRVFTYNPVTDTIAVLPAADNWPGGTTNLPGGAAVLNNKLYTIGGFTGAGMISNVWALDPTAASGSRWAAKANLPAELGYVPATTIGGFIYTAGGSAWNGTTLEDTFGAFKYDPTANAWTNLADIPRATGETRAVTLNGKMWVLGGGRTAPNPSNEVDIYDPATNTWSLGPPFVTARRNFPADSDGSRIWLAGGYAPTTGTNTMEILSAAGCPSPSPSPVATPTPTLTPTPTPPATPTTTPTPTPNPTPTRTPTPTPQVTPTPTASPSPGTRTAFDFDGDHKADVSGWRASTGEWWLDRSTAGVIGIGFGGAADKPRAADYTGDGKTDVAFFHPSTSEWFVLRSDNSTYYAFPWGASGDIPAPADFDGDGKADATVYRPSDTTWYIVRSTGGVVSVPFGISTDIPVPADYDGDGKADIAIYRPAQGQWWILRSSDGHVTASTFGTSTDKPVPGDYTGDGKADIAFWRPSTGEWFILRSENVSYYAFTWGANGDKPAPADYDNDGKFDPAVFRPSDTNWYILKSSGGNSIVPFGLPNDVPVPGQSVP